MNLGNTKMTSEKIKALKELVSKQALDPGLWFTSKVGFDGNSRPFLQKITIGEDCLQKALRELHQRIEEL